MARINVEDSLDADRRFFKLAVALGSQELAMGVLIYAWRLAQKHWKTDKRPIPSSEFFNKLLHADKLIGSEMAVLCELDGGEFYYIVGSEDQFNWLLGKEEAGQKGGKVSAQRPRDEKGRLLPSKQNKVQVESKQTQAGQATSSDAQASNQIQPSPLLCSTQSLINSNSIYTITSPELKKLTLGSGVTFGFDFDLVSEGAKRNWGESYSEEFIKGEIPKIKNWLIANPKKSKKTMRGWIKFLSNWFENNWGKYQRQFGSNKPGVDFSEVFGDEKND